MADDYVHVTSNECYVRNVIRPAAQPLWELRAGENVMAIYVVLKKDLPACLEIENASMHAGYI